jgi:dihydroorotate dehydrogenase/Pyruvate/2-oxoacid:ferredoxin oxidoreductase delta subunit
MVDLSVKFAGIELANPFMPAAHAPCAPWTNRKEAADIYMKMVRKYHQQGAGAFNMVSAWFQNRSELQWTDGRLRVHAMNTRGFTSREGFIVNANLPDSALARDTCLEVLSKIKKEFPDWPVIYGIAGPGIDPAGWGEMAKEAEQAGAQMAELNLATFMAFDEVKQALEAMGIAEKIPAVAGLLAGLVPEVVVKIIEGIREKTDIPIMLKITPELGFFRLASAAPMYLAAGANAVACGHALMSVAPPLIYEHGKCSDPLMEVGTFSAAIGGYTRPTCYRDVACVSKYAPGLDIAACGDLVIPEQCIEVMMLGAKAVQLSAGILWNGMSFMSQAIKFMKQFMEKQGYNKVTDFIGEGLPYIVEQDEFRKYWRNHPAVAEIDDTKCINCGTCLDTWCFATYMEQGKPKIDTNLCSGCNLCVIRCPSEARRIVLVKNR